MWQSTIIKIVITLPISYHQWLFISWMLESSSTIPMLSKLPLLSHVLNSIVPFSRYGPAQRIFHLNHHWCSHCHRLYEHHSSFELKFFSINPSRWVACAAFTTNAMNISSLEFWNKFYRNSTIASYRPACVFLKNTQWKR